MHVWSDQLYCRTTHLAAKTREHDHNTNNGEGNSDSGNRGIPKRGEVSNA